jgi:hypothetical protein
MIIKVMPLNHAPTYVRIHNRRPNYNQHKPYTFYKNQLDLQTLILVIKALYSTINRRGDENVQSLQENHTDIFSLAFT